MAAVSVCAEAPVRMAAQPSRRSNFFIVHVLISAKNKSLTQFNHHFLKGLAIICIMKLKIIAGLACSLIAMSLHAQTEDSLDNERLAKMVNLSEVIIRSDLNVAR